MEKADREERVVELGESGKGVGEMVSDALSIVRTNFKVLAVAAFPFCVLELLFREGSSAALAVVTSSFDPERPETFNLQGAVLPLAIYGGLLALSVLTGSTLYALGAIACRRVLRGRPLESLSLITAALKIMPKVATTAFIMSFFLMLLVVVPGAAYFGALFLYPETWFALVFGLLYMIYAVVVLLVFVLRWYTFVQVATLEGVWGFRGLRRAAQLTNSNGLPFIETPRVRLSILIFVFFAASGALQSVFAIPMLLTGMQQDPPMSDMSLLAMPIFLAVPVGVLQVLTSAALYPIGAILTALFYYDLRVRFEGYEIDDDA